MSDGILGFISRHKAATAVAAILGGLVLYSTSQDGTAQPGAGGGGGGASPLIPVSTGGGNVHEVVDRVGFDRPVRALTITAPQGWRVESDIRWDNVNGQCSSGVASPVVYMANADGTERIEVLPGFLVTTTSPLITNRGVQPGDFCIIANVPTGEQMLREVVVPRLRQGARLDQIRQLPLSPDLQALKTQVEQTPEMVGQTRTDFYSLEGWLTHPDGSVEVLRIAGYAFAGPQMIAGVPPVVLNTNTHIVSARASPQRIQALAQTAEAVVQSIQFDPQWKASTDETRRIVSAPVTPRSGGVRSTGGGGSGGGGVDMDAWRRREAESDEAQRRRIETIREEQRCVDPETGEVRTVSIHVGC